LSHILQGLLTLMHVIQAVAMAIITAEYYYTILIRSEFLHAEAVYSIPIIWD